MRLTNFDIDVFLRDYWQQKPLLIRNPFDAWSNPLEPDELAGLACEPDIESRLITGSQGDWAVEHGPLAEARFATLDQAPATVLVQAVDHHVPEVAALIEPFRFIPNWRIDDVMVSYATDGGGVGPHYDQYDVFLIQGAGTRRWRVGQLCDAHSPLLPHEDLRLLAEFQARDEWVLEPGDILYVPPLVAHDGIAIGDGCMTYSIGFRAPSRADLITDFADHVVADIEDDDRYADPGLSIQDNPGEISADALAALHAMISETLKDQPAFARWFGLHSSAPKYPDIDWSPEEPLCADTVRERIANGAGLMRNPASRFAFIRQSSSILLFVDGDCFDCTDSAADFAQRICAGDRPIIDTIDPAIEALIMQLINQGSLSFDDET